MSGRWEGTPFTPELVSRFRRAGWWRPESISDRVRARAEQRPDATAYGDAHGPVLTWRQYDEAADRLAGALAGLGAGPGCAVAVRLADGPWLHVAYVALERVGAVVVGIPAKAGQRDLHTAIERNAPIGLVADPQDALAAGIDRQTSLLWWLPLADDGQVGAPRWLGGSEPEPAQPRPLSPEDAFFVNTTSGTTGRPKAVAHNQSRWLRFAELAVDAGGLLPSDRVLSLVPTPYGFGLWSTHMLPVTLGVPVFQLARWDAGQALEVIRRERITVLMAVTTQLLMLLDEADDERGLGALRVIFTGGERVPADRAQELEERTGGVVLQFYGSNEAGGVSATRADDAQEDRLHTAGRVFEEMDVRLHDDDGGVIEARPARGQVAVRGPMMCSGYVGDPEAMRALIDDDGWMRLPDLAEIDERGYLTVVGRVSQLIIRGGLNISVAAVEAAVEEHPQVASAVAVPVDDPTYGERVGVALRLVEPGLDLDGLTAFLRERGHASSLWPEVVLVVDELPVGAGGKVDRESLRRAANGGDGDGVRVLSRDRRDASRR